MQTPTINTSELLTKAINDVIRDIYNSKCPGYYLDINPFQTYTEDEINKATYIYFNPDDQNWQLGFESPEELEAANIEDCKDTEITINNHNLPIYIY